MPIDKKDDLLNSIENAGLDELRELVKQLLVQKKSETAAALGVDAFAGLPIHLDIPECPLCKPFAEFVLDETTGTRHPLCHDCRQIIPPSIEFQNRGIESITVDHLHLHVVEGAGGRQIRVPAKRELCLPCFRIDWNKKFPDKECDL